MIAPTLSEQFWAIVDANWTYTQISRLTQLWKTIEDSA